MALGDQIRSYIFPQGPGEIYLAVSDLRFLVTAGSLTGQWRDPRSDIIPFNIHLILLSSSHLRARHEWFNGPQHLRAPLHRCRDLSCVGFNQRTTFRIM
jgi:hypothetical protein